MKNKNSILIDIIKLIRISVKVLWIEFLLALMTFIEFLATIGIFRVTTLKNKDKLNKFFIRIS